MARSVPRSFIASSFRWKKTNEKATLTNRHGTPCVHPLIFNLLCEALKGVIDPLEAGMEV